MFPIEIKRSLICLTATACLLMVETPRAQVPPNPQPAAEAAPPEQAFETIVVNARRREEDQQKVPAAVSALSGDDVRENRIETAADLQNFVPSLNVSNYVTHDSTVVIRGMGPTGGFGTVIGGGGTGVVSYFGDAVANISERALFYDLDSVQVIKGPQGTLFGKNTTGGVVLFAPRKPSDRFEGYAETMVGDYGQRAVTAAINLPLAKDVLSVRMAVKGYQQDGYTIDRGPHFQGKDYDNQKYLTGRLSVEFRPTQSIQNYSVLYDFRSIENGPGYVLTAINPSNPFNGLQAPFFASQQAAGVRSTSLSANEFDKRLDYGGINTTKWSVSDNFIVKNIFSAQVQKWENAQDLDGTPFIITDLVAARGAPWHIETATYSDEPQLQGTALNDDLTWTAGAYFDFSHNIGPQPYEVDVALGNFIVLQPKATNYARDHALYGQASYDLGNVDGSLRNLKFTAGYRYTWDSYGAGLALYSPSAGNACFTGPGTYSAATNYCLFADDGKNSGASWTLGLDYQLSNRTLLYVRSGQGYIPGGFNPAIGYVPGGRSTPQYRFAPEKNVDVELGVKSQFSLGGMKTLVDADVFHTDFTNIQRVVYELVSYNGLGIPSNFTANASESEIEGFEFQGSIIPTAGLEFGLNYSFDFAHYTHIDPLAAPSLVGIPFANLPRQKANITAAYTLPLDKSLGSVRLSGALSVQSRYFDAPAVQTQDYIAGYSLLNARLSWDDIYGSSFDASLFVTNATNTTYRSGQYGTYASDGRVISLYGAPRMYGLQLRYSFGRH